MCVQQSGDTVSGDGTYLHVESHGHSVGSDRLSREDEGGGKDSCQGKDKDKAIDHRHSYRRE